jgi:hypothetical protein
MADPTCKKCGDEHDDPRRAYCPPCAEIVRLEFGNAKGGGVRIDLHGDPDRPVRRMEMVRP